MQLSVKNKIGAEFKMIVRKASDDSVVNETPFFLNQVLNTGLDRMNVGNWIDRCCVGTDNSEPLITQTQLGGFVASTTTKLSTSGAISTPSPCFYSLTITWRFAVGIAAGNLSEVGLGWGNSNLWNRSQIKDINGNPTTITVLPDEYLDVISVIKVYPTELIEGTFDLLDKNSNVISAHTCVGKPFLEAPAISSHFEPVNIGSSRLDVGFLTYSGAIGANVTSKPSGQLSNWSTSKTQTRVGRTSKSAILLGIDLANGASHRSILAYISGIFSQSSSACCGYQFEFTPPLRAKKATETMMYNLSITWDRI